MNDNTKELTPLAQQDADISNSVASESDRRAALGKIGRFSAYAAPAMLALLSGHANAGISDGGGAED